MSLIAVAEGTSIRLRRRRVVTRAWPTTERCELALSSAELHQRSTRAKRLRAPAEVVGRSVWLGKPRGVPAGAQIFHRKGPRGRNGPSADGARDRYGDYRATKVCRPNHRNPARSASLLLEQFVWPQKLFSSRAVRFSEGVAVQPRGLAVAAINVRAGLLAGGLFGFRFLRDFAVMGRSSVCAGEDGQNEHAAPRRCVCAGGGGLFARAYSLRHRGANTRSDTQSPNSAADRKRISLPVSRGGRTTFICSRLP